MLDLDAILDQALAEGELIDGYRPEVVSLRNPGVSVLSELVVSPAPARAPAWTPEEEQFVKDHLGYYTDDEIAAVLGRTGNAIKIRRQRKDFSGYTNHPNFLTAQGCARALGVDAKSIILLMDRHLLPNWWRIGDRGVYLVKKITLYRWAVNPLHWPYFIRAIQQDRLGDPHLRRLIHRQRQRWNDDWWTPGQVAAHHHAHHTDVNRYIHAGKIQATKWGNWWIRRSEATRPDLTFYRGTGSAQRAHWTPAGNRFLIQARAQGHSWEAIARMMKIQNGWQLQNRYKYITTETAK